MSIEDSRCKFEKDRFYVAEQYIQTSKNLIDNLIKKDNPLVLISDHAVSEDELAESLKDSSQYTVLPILFCLYQGIELILKGFVSFKCDTKGCHEAEDYCEKFQRLYPKEQGLSSMFNKFVHPEFAFIMNYMKLNNINNISKFYNSLRYPDKRDGTTYDYEPLTCPNNDSFLPQMEKLKNDIEQLLGLSVKLFRTLDDEN